MSDEEKDLCEGLLTTEECQKVLKSFKQDKSPGNDGLTVEFYKQFWSLFGKLMVNSFNSSYVLGELSASQRQAVITLLDKGKNRQLLKNWRPISLLNVDYKIMSKALATRMTTFLQKLIHSDQVGYVKGRNIHDNIRTVIDMLTYLEDNNLPGILINIDFKKAFDSVSWAFLDATLLKFNFGPSFTHWIKTLYGNISSCVKSNGSTSKYFPVNRGVRQGDPLSPYLFILVVEIMSSAIRQDRNIEGIQLKETQVKVLQYADDTNGLLKNLSSAKKFLTKVKEFGDYSGLILNKEKTEAMWLGSRKSCPHKPLGILWPNRPLRILGVYASYDKEACERLNFLDRISKAKRLINLWHTRNLTMYGRNAKL